MGGEQHSIIQTSADQVIRKTGRKGGREMKGGREVGKETWWRMRKVRSAFRDSLIRRSGTEEDRRQQTGFRRHSGDHL